MDAPTPSPDLETVEREIRQGFRLLRFSPPIERQFEQDTAENRCRHMIRQNYIGIVIYHFFLFSDQRVVGDVFQIDLLLHFAVMTPVMILTNLVLACRPRRWVRAGAEAAAVIVLTATIVVLTCQSRMPDRDIMLWTIVLVVLFMIVVQGIEFVYAVAASLAIFVIFAIGTATFETASADRILMTNSIMAGVMVFSLVGSYTLEHRQRTGYLLTLRDRLRNEVLEIASLRDALTGIGNRRALDAALLRLLARRGAGPVPASTVLLLDIDHFKAFNDGNGHQAGDRCLKRVAEILAGSVRSDEGTVYRFGGEEFLILLDGVSGADASRVAERVRARVAEDRIPRDAAGTAFVTISVGIASGQLGRDATAETLIAEADAALYAAKRGGRNRIWPPAQAEAPSVECARQAAAA
ncbi:GGDEF domain-containing protein [Methylobacterium nigriterrae]|uniref:GGDEF domain-containing protein n=1 Tax=Methylobacterium nigriterrae TaxID=3127512 RepID=UPI0030135C5C